MAKKRSDPKTDRPVPLPVTAKDFEPFSECDQRLSDLQVEALVYMTYYRLVLVAQQLGTDFSPLVEAAFLNGAASALFACKTQDRLPAAWVFGNGRMLDVLAGWKAEGRLKGTKGGPGSGPAEGGGE